MVKKNLVTLEGLDARVARIENLLPTLATKADLAAAIAPLATKVEVEAAITVAVAPLATRREMLALHESLRDDIRILADSVLSLHAKVDARL